LHRSVFIVLVAVTMASLGLAVGSASAPQPADAVQARAAAADSRIVRELRRIDESLEALHEDLVVQSSIEARSVAESAKSIADDLAAPGVLSFAGDSISKLLYDICLSVRPSSGTGSATRC
jgi:hypothetical protein